MDRINGTDTVDIGQGRRGFKDENVQAGIAGTEVTASFLNGLQEEMAKVIEQELGPLDPNDWTQLWQALQAMVTRLLGDIDTDRFLESVGGYDPDTNILKLNMSDGAKLEIDIAQLFNDYTKSDLLDVIKNNPLYPEILTPDNRMSITSNGNGEITINPNQEWLWRGLIKKNTAMFDAAELSLSTVPSKTYHLRWNAPGKGNAEPEADWLNGRFELIDLTNANPPENDRQYDTHLDRMLIALIVTDADNIPMITSFVNTHSFSYFEEFYTTAVGYYSNDRSLRTTFTAEYNFSRTPIAPNIQSIVGHNNPGGAVLNGVANHSRNRVITRYSTTWEALSDWNGTGVTAGGRYAYAYFGVTE